MVVSQFVKLVVDTQFSEHPIHFVHQQNGSVHTMELILRLLVPDMTAGLLFFVNPLLLLGHTQTAYTGLQKFDHVDHVWYKRRILTIASDKKFYEVDGDKLAYDKWHGHLTIAVDYVVPESALDANHLEFKPESQVYDLPPRTEYLDPAKEQELLDSDKPLVIALHGLLGGSYELYIRAFLHEITQEPYNFDALVINARGCANHTITSPQLFNGLWTNDLRYLINEHIKEKWPHKRVYMIGFSLGGAILANYLGQELDRVWPNIKAAAIMGTPWDFPDSSVNLKQLVIGYNVYSPTMCSNLLRLLSIHGTMIEMDEDSKKQLEVLKTKEPKKLKQFDNFFTLRLFGFNSADEYYRHASPNQRLLKVRVPTVIVLLLDDPITGYRTLPRSEVKLNPYVLLVTTTIGGHLGWFQLNGRRWYPSRILKLFTELDQYKVDTDDTPELPRDVSKVWKHDQLAFEFNEQL